MKTYEKLRNATSVEETEKIMKDFWDSYVESEEHGRILQSIYDCYYSGMDKNDPYLVQLSKDLEREQRRLWIEHGLYPEDHDFDRVLTEEEAKRIIEWFGENQGE